MPPGCVGLMKGWCVDPLTILRPVERLGDVDVVGTDDVVARREESDEVSDDDEVEVDVEPVGEVWCCWGDWRLVWSCGGEVVRLLGGLRKKVSLLVVVMVVVVLVCWLFMR